MTPSSLPVVWTALLSAANRGDAIRLEAARAASFVLERLEARVLLSAHLDLSFGEGGDARAPAILAGTQVEFYADIQRLDFQPDRKILVAGLMPGSQYDRTVLQRLLPDGTADASFHFGGDTTGWAPLRLLTQPADGGIVIVNEGGLARVNQDGSNDPGFKSRALATGDGYWFLQDAALLPDGRIMAVGYSIATNPQANALLMRFLPDGTPDESFGHGGALTPCPGFLAEAFMAVQPDGKLLLFDLIDNVGEIRRFMPDGSPDFSFGLGGRVVTEQPSIALNTGSTALLLQPDGKIVVLVDDSTTGNSSVLRFKADGGRDPEFGQDGCVVFGRGIRVTDISLQSDGKLVAVGSRREASGYSTVVLRLNSNGSADALYGVGGETEFRVGAMWPLAKVQDGDKLVVLMDRDFDHVAAVDANGWSDAVLFNQFHLIRIYDDGLPPAGTAQDPTDLQFNPVTDNNPVDGLAAAAPPAGDEMFVQSSSSADSLFNSRSDELDWEGVVQEVWN